MLDAGHREPGSLRWGAVWFQAQTVVSGLPGPVRESQGGLGAASQG